MAYTAAYVFGDSLVDSGNALKLAEWYDGFPFTDLPEGAPTAEDGYFKGRFSDGYTFADLVANKAIGRVTKPVFPYEFEDPWLGVPIAPFASDPKGNNLNFAYGGSHIIGGEIVPDFDEQTDAFRHAVDGDADPNGLYLVTLGGNDIRDLAQTGSDPVPQAQAYAVLDEAAAELIEELRQLIEIGAHNIVITGIPDVGLIPRYDRDSNDVLDATEQMRSAAATDYSIYLDTLIRTEVVPALQALGANVIYVPVMDYQDSSGNLVTGALNAILPTIAALHGLTTEQLLQNWLHYQGLVFFDEVHPNAQANALVGAYMWAQITGTPWVETLPLSGADLDYRVMGTIAAPGEIDQLVVSLKAGTTYRLEMLGVSSLGLTGSLADPLLRLLGPSGNLIGTSGDEGVGFDATLTFTAASSGNYTVQFLSTGAPIGFYAIQAAVISGAAMNSGNTYVVANASTVVLESADGVGQDVIKTSVSYALSQGSEIEVLRTTNNYGTAPIDLTGNEFGQTIIGNAGNNILTGNEGRDVMTGRGGNDVFVLSNAAIANMDGSHIDRITDYSSIDTIDITQILSVALGTNPIAGGYVRVTTSGLVQVDVDGGGNQWVTLSTINNGGAVTVRYLAGGLATNVSVSRVLESQQMAFSAANSSATLVSAAVAAAGLLSVPAAAEKPIFSEQSSPSTGIKPAEASSFDPGLYGDNTSHLLRPVEIVPATEECGSQQATLDASFDNRHGDNELGMEARSQSVAPVPESSAAATPAPFSAVTAAAVAMPSAEALQQASMDQLDGKEGIPVHIAQALLDALTDGGPGGSGIQAMLNALTGAAAASPAALQPGVIADGATLTMESYHTAAQLMVLHPIALHHDAVQAV